MRVVFFGTPEFAATILEYLIKQPIEIVAVVTRPDKPKGRSLQAQPNAVKKVAKQFGYPLFQPPKASDPEFASYLESLDADFFIVAAYAEILRENILKIPKLACLNVHGSILPYYRGAAPVQRALMAGESETGVTIMKMALEMDAGDIYSIVKIPIPEEMNAGELFEAMAKVGAPALWDVMQKIEKKEIQPTPQDHALATYTKKVKPEDGEIVWTHPARHIHNQIRGLTPNPGAWVWASVKGEKRRLRVKRARVIKEDSLAKPGELIPLKSQLVIRCGSDALELLEVQLEGKKAMAADAFLRGVGVITF